MNNIYIKPYKKQEKTQLITVWEQSVLATHHFLKENDFLEIKALVKNIDFSSLSVFCAHYQNRIIGFIGVFDKKIEMLFIHPDFTRKGLGKKLIDFAIQQLNANKVDVNEQNERALAFYKKRGFIVYDRNETDDQGKNYPILKMTL